MGELVEEGAELQTTIGMVMQEMKKLNIGAGNTVEPMLQEGPLNFLERWVDRVRPRNNTVQLDDHTGELMKPPSDWRQGLFRNSLKARMAEITGAIGDVKSLLHWEEESAAGDSEVLENGVEAEEEDDGSGGRMQSVAKNFRERAGPIWTQVGKKLTRAFSDLDRGHIAAELAHGSESGEGTAESPFLLEDTSLATPAVDPPSQPAVGIEPILPAIMSAQPEDLVARSMPGSADVSASGDQGVPPGAQVVAETPTSGAEPQTDGTVPSERNAATAVNLIRGASGKCARKHYLARSIQSAAMPCPDQEARHHVVRVLVSAATHRPARVDPADVPDAPVYKLTKKASVRIVEEVSIAGESETECLEGAASPTILIEASVKIGDGSVKTLWVKATDRPKDVAQRFVREHSLKQWFEDPLTRFLKQVEADATSFPAKVEADLGDIRQKYPKKAR